MARREPGALLSQVDARLAESTARAEPAALQAALGRTPLTPGGLRPVCYKDALGLPRWEAEEQRCGDEAEGRGDFYAGAAPAWGGQFEAWAAALYAGRCAPGAPAVREAVELAIERAREEAEEAAAGAAAEEAATVAAEAAAEAARALAALEIQASVLAVAQSRHAGSCGRQRSCAATAFPYRAHTHTHTHTHTRAHGHRPPGPGIVRSRGIRPPPARPPQVWLELDRLLATIARLRGKGQQVPRSPPTDVPRFCVVLWGGAQDPWTITEGTIAGGERPPLPHFPLDLDRCPCGVQVPVPSQLIGLMPPAPEAGGWPVDFELAKMGAPTTASRRTDGSRLSTTLSATRPVGAAA